MIRAVIAAGWDRVPAGLVLREFEVLPVPDARAWRAAAEAADVELAASVVVARRAAAGESGEALPGEVLAWHEASGDAGLCRAALRADAAALRSRVLTDPSAAAARCDAARRAGRRVVFTNGVFDLLHLGHVRLLRAARALGSYLVVGINSDSSARALKGRSRPVVPQFARAEMVASVRGVDLCVIFSEPDPVALLRVVRPAVLAKGSEYSLSTVVGRQVVERQGGTVVLLPHVHGWSSTRIIASMKGRS